MDIHHQPKPEREERKPRTWKNYKVRISRGGSAGYVIVLARTQSEAMKVAEAQNPGAGPSAPSSTSNNPSWVSKILPTRAEPSPLACRMTPPDPSPEGRARASSRPPGHEVPAPSAGIYYVLRLPAAGWRVWSYRYAEQPDTVDHSEFWEEFVAPALAREWAGHLGSAPAALTRRLKRHTYGFPRGRVAVPLGSSRHVVLHGRDLRPFMGVAPAFVEGLFGIAGRASWEEDEHEHCQVDDRDAVRALLRLSDGENWAAV